MGSPQPEGLYQRGTVLGGLRSTAVSENEMSRIRALQWGWAVGEEIESAEVRSVNAVARNKG